MTRGSRQVHLDVHAKVAWSPLVSPERHRWYYRLTPDGEFAEGSTIRWLDAGGAAAEESEIVEVKPPKRLVMHTRYLYSAAFAKQPPHTLTWEVARAGNGCRVRMSWDANEVVAGLLESEADNILQGLRVEHDPAAQAEIARLPTIGEITVHDVTPERLADYLAFFDHDAFRDYPGWQSCYCMETHRTQTDEEWAVRTADDNRRDMSKGITGGTGTGLLAYVDGKAVGWANYGETTRLNGGMHPVGPQAAGQRGGGPPAGLVNAAPDPPPRVAAALPDAPPARPRARRGRVPEADP